MGVTCVHVSNLRKIQLIAWLQATLTTAVFTTLMGVSFNGRRANVLLPALQRFAGMRGLLSRLPAPRGLFGLAVGQRGTRVYSIPSSLAQIKIAPHVRKRCALWSWPLKLASTTRPAICWTRSQRRRCCRTRSQPRENHLPRHRHLLAHPQTTQSPHRHRRCQSRAHRRRQHRHRFR